MPFPRKILPLLLLVAAQTGHSQNLVCNYSFEDVNICTELNAPCFPSGWFPVSPNYVNKAHFLENTYVMQDGDRCMGFLYEPPTPATDTSGRTYLQTQLLCPMKKGRQYNIEFFVFNTETKYQPVGFYFSPHQVYMPRQTALAVAPDIIFKKENSKQADKKNDIQWYKVEGIYEAKGNEKFLVIGNFSGAVAKTANPIWCYIDMLFITPADHVASCPDSRSIVKRLYKQHLRHIPFNLEEPVTKVLEDTLVNATPSVVVKKPVADTLILPDVLFDFNSAHINPAFQSLLDSLVINISRHAYQAIEITGFTDSIGTDSYNKTLSLNRANSISRYLLQQLPALKSKLITAGAGALHPVASNQTPAGRKANRRVQVVLLKKE